MADLKVGSTVGGLPIWHAGTFPLVPVGNTLTYRGKKIYSEIDKPQADDNDFVSKSKGGTYEDNIELKGSNVAIGIAIGPSNNAGRMGIRSGGTGGNTFVVGGGAAGIIIRPNGLDDNVNTSQITLKWDKASFPMEVNAAFVTANRDPANGNELTRRSWVDTRINTVDNTAKAAVKRAGDTMTGNLTAPNFISDKEATDAKHVPQWGQVVPRDSIQDFGNY
ncbi:tail fiber hinge connector [Klebsiella phage Metamorpho]|nr:tail fiber hinge connector [Klebsiella phage Metamorpho]